MSLTERIGTIANILHCFRNRIEGRKKMQKIIYLSQEFGFMDKLYNFEWNYYGVYSQDLSSDIQSACGFDLIEEEKEIDAYNNVKYEIRLKENPDIEFKACSKRKNKFFHEINQLDVKELEVISSIIYFRRKGYLKEKIDGLLKSYKGHLGYLFDSSFEEIGRLESLANQG
jgi:hypothetical protein